ncbi:MAG: hypothetical protein HYY06_26815 [Deltaproteobacteria bacterium]|nr:hypothetical protein [Deltaproteobacteria bacterium]
MLAVEQTEAGVRSTGEVVVLGGAANRDLWPRIGAYATARRVVRNGTVEATCLRACTLAAAGAGLHTDLAIAVRAIASLSGAIEPGTAGPTVPFTGRTE